MAVSDPSPDMADVYRRMTGAERLQLAIEMSERAKEEFMARLRQEHPDWAEWEYKREWFRHAFGDEPLPPGFEEWLREHDRSRQPSGRERS